MKFIYSLYFLQMNVFISNWTECVMSLLHKIMAHENWVVYEIFHKIYVNVHTLFLPSYLYKYSELIAENLRYNIQIC